MSLEVKGTILGVAAALAALGAAFGVAPALQPHKSADIEQKKSTVSVSLNAAESDAAKEGYKLFDRNCAHCHGDDVRGDEGPSLYNLAKSDTRLATIIAGGIKGEMPAFAKKFTDDEVHAVISYLRTLKE